jgi:hypothetical protein
MVTSQCESVVHATPILFSPGLLGFLAKQGGSFRCQDILERNDHNALESDTITPPAPVPDSQLQSKENSLEFNPTSSARATERLSQQIIGSPQKKNPEIYNPVGNSKVLWASLAVTTATGLTLYATRKSFSTQKTSLKKIVSQPTSTAKGLLYTSLAANLIGSGTLLYTVQQKNSTLTESHLKTLDAWEQSASKRAVSREAALQQQYESRLEFLVKQHSDIQTDIQHQQQAIQSTHATALASISNSQTSAIRSINQAEDSAWVAARQSEAVARAVTSQLAKLEAKNAALNTRLRTAEQKLERETASLGEKLRDTENRLEGTNGSLGRRVQDSERRLSEIIRHVSRSVGKTKEKQE